MFIVAIDGSAVATALPTMARELHTSVAWVTWTVSAYSLGSVTGLPLAGRVSDAFGRKRMFIFFVLAFTATTLACGFANNIFLLIGLRFLQASWGSGLLPSAIGIISDQFGAGRDRPVGLTTTVFPLGAMLGPAIGGLIVTYASWRYIFFVNVPIGIVMTVLLWMLLPADRRPATRSFGIDVLGSLLFALTILCVMLGSTELGDSGGTAALGWPVLAASLGFGAAFWWWQGRSRHPILAAELLKQRPFVVVNLVNIVYGAAAFGVFSLVPLYAQLRYGIRPLEAGALLTVRAAGMAVMSTVTSFLLLQRFGYRRPIAVAFAILLCGLVMLAVPPIWLSVYGWLTVACLVCGLGVGMAGPPSNNAALQVLPSRIGETTAFRSVFRQTGGIVALSAAAAWVSSSGNGAGVLPYVFLVLSLLTVIASPLIVQLPESRRPIPAAEPLPAPGP